MAFPWIFAENFESGTKGNFDTLSDSSAQASIAHYKTLANLPWKAAPHSGAYCWKIVLSGGTADATYSEADVDISAAGTAYFHFNVWFSPNFTGTADDTFVLFEAQGAGSAVEVAIGARIVAATNVINIGAGLATPTSFAAQEIQRGKWYTIEAKVLLDSGVGNDGTIDIYITREGDPAQAASQIALTALDQIAVTDGFFGMQNQLATTTGTILLDNFIMDDGRIYPTPRYQIDPVMTQSQHIFVGPGWIAGAAILGGTSPTLILYDTDQADTNGTIEVSLATGSTNQSSIGGHVFFQKGCYAVLGGTTPSAQVMCVRSDINPGVYGPLYMSDSGIKRLARGG